MKLCKKLIIGFVIVVSLIMVIIFIWQKNGHQEAHLSIDFRKFVKQENISLTIYYLNPNIRTRYGVSLKSLMNKMHQYKVTVSRLGISNYLDITEYKYLDLLNKINEVNLLPGKSDSINNCRVYYYFEDNKGRKLLSVTLLSDKGNIIVNGHNVKKNKIFYDIIMPFLPQDAVDGLNDSISK